MAARYYLDCSCGKRLTAEPRHAGSQLQCDCGATLEVPTLRGLQALPRAEDRLEEKKPVWTLRHAIVTACVVVAAILFGVGLYHLWREYQIHQYLAALEDKTILMAAMETDVAKLLDEGTPLMLWRYWEVDFKLNSREGFADLRAPRIAYTEAAIRAKRIERYVWWAASAIVLIGALAWAKFAPR